MLEEIQKSVAKCAKDLFGQDIEIELTRPAEAYGDYATNVALRLGAKLNKKPADIAKELATKLQEIEGIQTAQVAGPGFINLSLTDEKLAIAASNATNLPQSLAGQTIVLEHTDPNPFKEFHIGHAYSNTVGAAIGKLLEASGAEIHQVSYHGDVGLHIAMAVWEFGEDKNWNPAELAKIAEQPSSTGIKILGLYYKKGAEDYRNDEKRKKIEELNQYIYAHLGDKEDPKMQFYYYGHERSFSYFNFIYEKILKTPKFNNSNKVFEHEYLESEMASEGMKIVLQNAPGVFEKSDGAIIYDGEKIGLHKRVFITQQNLPTYEAKEIGLAFAKERDYKKAKKFIVVTANEIDEYFKVLVAAISEINEDLADKILHKSHGVIKLPSGKMSSRTGDVKSIVSADVDIGDALRELHGEEAAKSEIVFGAMKYAFLKHRLGEDIVYDPQETMSIEGNSGPYLQYAYARACSVLKGGSQPEGIRAYPATLNDSERSLALKISEYPEVVAKATADLMPHHICTYLYELAQSFNRFYELNRVLGSNREIDRITLVQYYAAVLKSGLGLLNIAAPERI